MHTERDEHIKQCYIRYIVYYIMHTATVSYRPRGQLFIFFINPSNPIQACTVSSMLHINTDDPPALSCFCWIHYSDHIARARHNTCILYTLPSLQMAFKSWAVVGLMDRALDLKPEVTQGCGFESRLRKEVHDCSPGAAQSAAHCSRCVHLDGLNAENTFHSSLYSV